jgi:predicted ATPase/DNA-binding XRE family transcriptional regulator
VGSFADLLKHSRAAAGLTQEELAERAGLSARAISDLERGVKRQPYPHTIGRLVQALGLTENEAARFQRAARRLGGAGGEAEERGEGGLQSLPIQPTPFIGRQLEMEEITTLLGRDEVRLLTLTGPGGVGKTRLALRVAEQLVDRFPDRVVFVSLASLTDARMVADSIATALEITDPGAGPILESVIAHLRGKRLLLVADNFEHLLPAADVLSRLLASCPQLTILVTSRSILHLAAEHEYQVPPLPVPTPSHLPELDVLSRYDAVQLFLQRARAVKPWFELTEENAEAIAGICYRLEGLPLAIELAAARIRLFPPHALFQRLSDRLQVLASGPIDVPARQQTLRDTIDWSYRLLTQDEQRLIARLSVFAGGCTLPAAEAVCHPTIAVDLLAGLTSLVEQSLLRQVGEDEPRYRMLETIREYASDWLEASGEARTVRRQHAEYFVRWAQEAHPRTKGGEQIRWLDRMEQEHDNLRAALRWFHEQEELEQAALLACALDDLWLNRGHGEEAAQWITMLLSTPDSVSRPTRARLLTVSRWFTDHMASMEEALQLYRELDDVAGCALVLCRMADLVTEAGDSTRGARLASEGLALARQVGDPLLIAENLQVLGVAVGCDGELDRARGLLAESLALFRAVGNPGTVAWTARWLAWVACLQGDYPLAATLGDEVFGIEQDLSNRLGITAVTWILALARLELGQVQQAKAHLRDGLLLVRQGGPGGAMHLEATATVAARRGQLERAARLWGAVDAVQSSNPRWWPTANRAWRAYFGRHRDVVRTQLGDAAWEEGQGMTVEQAVTYALDDTHANTAGLQAVAGRSR